MKRKNKRIYCLLGWKRDHGNHIIYTKKCDYKVLIISIGSTWLILKGILGGVSEVSPFYFEFGVFMDLPKLDLN